jgi:hypothetical protein
MPRLKDVCRYVRSKNAGPFWVTVDLFFDSADNFAQYHADPAISAESIAGIYGVDAGHVKRFEVKSLNMVTICTAVSNSCRCWNCSFVEIRCAPDRGPIIGRTHLPLPSFPSFLLRCVAVEAAPTRPILPSQRGNHDRHRRHHRPRNPG